MYPTRRQSLLLALLVLLSCGAAADDVEAQLGWADLYIVSSPQSGRVKQVLVHAGDAVKPGQLLVQLDRRLQAYALDAARAKLAAQRPRAADAEREYEQGQSLYEQTVLSDVELQRLQVTRDVERAALQQAEAELASAQKHLDDTALHAPWAGWVLQREVQPGQVIDADDRAQPLLWLARAGKMLATAKVDATAVAELRTGQALTLRVGPHSYSGRLRSLSPLQADAGAAAKPVQQWSLQVAFDADMSYPPAAVSAVVELP